MGGDSDSEREAPSLVRATEADVDAITRLVQAAYARWVPLIGRKPMPMEADYAAAIRMHRIDLMLDGLVLAGLIETTRRDNDLLVVNVAVDPAYQGRGLGKRLLAHAESLTRAAGLGLMRLYTNSRFTENIRLYAALGYRVEREEAVNGGIRVHMVKKLGRPENSSRDA